MGHRPTANVFFQLSQQEFQIRFTKTDSFMKALELKQNYERHKVNEVNTLAEAQPRRREVRHDRVHPLAVVFIRFSGRVLLRVCECHHWKRIVRSVLPTFSC